MKLESRTLIVLLTVGLGLLHFAIILTPDAFIFDEIFYVEASRSLVQGVATNHEHPPMAKLAMAGSILVFGDNPIGWRFYSVVTGTLLVPLVFLLVRKYTEERVALLASAFIALDTMLFVHGSAGLLDAPSLFFIVLSVYAYSKDRIYLSGILSGVAILHKLPVALVTLSILTWHLLRNRNWSGVLDSAKHLAIAGIVFLVVLGIYDMAYGIFPTPLHHVQFMLSYHGGLSGGEGPLVANPLEWITIYEPASYYVTKIAGRVTLGYYGIGNMILWWSTWLVVPLAGIRILKRENPNPLLKLSFIWFLGAFLPYLPLALMGRVTYPYYFLNAVPALAILLALMTGKDRTISWTLVGMMTLWFILWFPLKVF